MGILSFIKDAGEKLFGTAAAPAQAAQADTATASVGVATLNKVAGDAIAGEHHLDLEIAKAVDPEVGEDAFLGRTFDHQKCPGAGKIADGDGDDLAIHAQVALEVDLKALLAATLRARGLAFGGAGRAHPATIANRG